MSSKSVEPKQCIVCNKAGGIMICDGCKQTFCGKHVVEHRQQLALQLEYLMQDHDCIQQDLAVQRDEHPSFEQIDAWEKKSIAQIQVAAKKTRDELRQVLAQADERLRKTCQDIAMKLRAAREEENFSEIDLTRWTEQLNELRTQMKSVTMITLSPTNHSSIHFLRIQQENSSKNLAQRADLQLLPISTRERFSDANGLAIIDNQGLRIRHNGDDGRYIYARGHELYSRGQHRIRFHVDRCAGSSALFIGICSSNVPFQLLLHHLSVVVGWFSNHTVWQHEIRSQNANVSECKNNDIQSNDIVELLLDCEKKQIELICPRTHVRHTMKINLNKSPLPWRILLALRQKNDCVRILSNE